MKEGSKSHLMQQKATNIATISIFIPCNLNSYNEAISPHPAVEIKELQFSPRPVSQDDLYS